MCRGFGGRTICGDFSSDVIPFEFFQRKGTCETYTHEGALLPDEGYGFTIAEIGELEDELHRERDRAA